MTGTEDEQQRPSDPQQHMRLEDAAIRRVAGPPGDRSGVHGFERGWRRECTSVAWQIPGSARRMHRLPYAGTSSRQAGHVPVPGRLRCGVGFQAPGLGIFAGPHLTPDNDTGLGNWTKDEITTAIQTGVRPDGRILASVMPWRAYAGLTKSDAAAIVEYLTSLRPIGHKVPGPVGLDEKPAIFRMTILPPDYTSQRD